jgi:hypothetical protein
MAIVGKLESQLTETEADFVQQREEMLQKHADALARLAQKEQTVLGTMAARVKEKELLLERSQNIEHYLSAEQGYSYKIAQSVSGVWPVVGVRIDSLPSFMWYADKITFRINFHLYSRYGGYIHCDISCTIAKSVDPGLAKEFFEQRRWRFLGIKLTKGPPNTPSSRLLFDFSPLINSIVSVPGEPPYRHNKKTKLVDYGDESLVGCLYPKLTFIDRMTCLVGETVLVLLEGGFSEKDLIATMPDGSHAVYLVNQKICVPI